MSVIYKRMKEAQLYTKQVHLVIFTERRVLYNAYVYEKLSAI